MRIKLLHSASKVIDCDGTLSKVSDCDVKTNTLNSAQSLTRKLRRVRQGLDFIKELFQNFWLQSMHFLVLQILPENLGDSRRPRLQPQLIKGVFDLFDSNHEPFINVADITRPLMLFGLDASQPRRRLLQSGFHHQILRPSWQDWRHVRGFRVITQIHQRIVLRTGWIVRSGMQRGAR
ncbi:hypothetical protein L1987_32673 [Smallanthus sonchifolius]|uniref:Uncharacterized protein n=1 Tax=Smallanthus sonchifolius TaxID=185202 RepID=A0ACB9HQ44_9ASTR|nr:hypothetical protein L1987_32673 [Smallanthus sonchifolius]